jgi:hypothetical protein
MYSGDGELLAEAAVPTEPELKLDSYRRDMAYMRDSFGGVIVASGLAGAWLLVGAETANVAGAILAGSIGAVSLDEGRAAEAATGTGGNTAELTSPLDARLCEVDAQGTSVAMAGPE